MAKLKRGWAEYTVNLMIRGVIGATMALPYRWRVPFMGWVMARVAAPIAGWDKRVRDNLALVFPDLPAIRGAAADGPGAGQFRTLADRDLFRR